MLSICCPTMAVDAYEALICQLLTDKNLLVQLACNQLFRKRRNSSDELHAEWPHAHSAVSVDSFFDAPSAGPHPSEWRDVQNIQADVGHYIISDRPLTETSGSGD
jgi:hypothetical protein